MDPPTMAVTLRREDLALRYFQPPAALLLPAGGATRVVYPTALPPDPDANGAPGELGGADDERGALRGR